MLIGAQTFFLPPDLSQTKCALHQNSVVKREERDSTYLPDMEKTIETWCAIPGVCAVTA